MEEPCRFDLGPDAGRRLCLGELSAIPGLRLRRIIGFPCGWFYSAATDHLDVVRLLDDAQDLPAILADTAGATLADVPIQDGIRWPRAARS